MSETPTPKIIAEVGCNHRGELATALEMIDRAAEFCRVDGVKFQKRTVQELLSPEEYGAPHPTPWHSYGSTYGEHRKHLELSVADHRRLLERCRERGIVYSTSVWDVEAARQILPLEPEMLKVPSAANLNLELLRLLADEYGGEIHVSLGMTDRREEDRLVKLLLSKGRGADLVLYSCTSGYPVPFDQICLLEVRRLHDAWGDEIRAVGFSGHHLGIAADVAALALGARVFERHFTLDRTWRGTDHAASLEPDGLRRLTRDLRNVSQALTEKDPPILPLEKAQRSKLKRPNGLPDPGPSADGV